MAILIDWLMNRFATNKVLYSRHADEERMNDGLTMEEICSAVQNSRILEEYPDTGRGESVLIAGFTDSGKPVHLVCGTRNGWVVVVTVYIPSPPKFRNVFERGEF